MSKNITLDELENKLAFMRKMYDAVRLVDPIKKVVLESRGNSCCEMDQQCYAYWNKGKICDNCVSIRAYRSNNCHYKLMPTEQTTFFALRKKRVEIMLTTGENRLFHGGNTHRCIEIYVDMHCTKGTRQSRCKGFNTFHSKTLHLR